jgi:hypothetical protein
MLIAGFHALLFLTGAEVIFGRILRQRPQKPSKTLKKSAGIPSFYQTGGRADRREVSENSLFSVA